MISPGHIWLMRLSSSVQYWGIKGECLSPCHLPQPYSDYCSMRSLWTRMPTAITAEVNVVLMQPLGHHLWQHLLECGMGMAASQLSYSAAQVTVLTGQCRKSCLAEEWDPWPRVPQPDSSVVPSLVTHGTWPRATLLEGAILGWCETYNTSWLNLRAFEGQRPPQFMCAHFCVCLTRMIIMGLLPLKPLDTTSCGGTKERSSQDQHRRWHGQMLSQCTSISSVSVLVWVGDGSLEGYKREVAERIMGWWATLKLMPCAVGEYF